MNPSKITVVVLNWNNKSDTLACLESLRQADLGGAEVVVVDNGSRDGSVAAVQARFPEVQLVELSENRGYAGGNNAGIRHALAAGAEGVLLLNNDTCVAPDFLRPLLWTFDIDPDAGAVSSAIHRLDRPDMLDVAYSQVHFGQREAVQIRGVNALPGHGFGERREVQVAVGCSLLLSAKALRAVGLFDEAYFAYHEDVDWCLRARGAGFKVYYEPMSRVFHRRSSTTQALARRPAALVGRVEDDLPQAEPLPWNPVRAYLGARNLVRLLRAHASPREKRSFLRSCVRELPLEFLAVIKEKEGWLRLGRWGYKSFLREHFVERHAFLSEAGTVSKVAGALLLLPIDLFWALPREIHAAYRQGRLQQFFYYLRGLRDGVLDRPLPLEWLGLR
jgi:GT2 family glycosyltransferase